MISLIIIMFLRFTGLDGFKLELEESGHIAVGTVKS